MDEVLDEDSKEVLGSLNAVKRHGKGKIIVEVVDHTIFNIDETITKRRGKEFSRYNPRRDPRNKS